VARHQSNHYLAILDFQFDFLVEFSLVQEGLGQADAP